MSSAFPALAVIDMDGTLLSVSSERLFLEHMLRRRLISPAGLARFAAGYAMHPLRSLREGKGWNRRYLAGIGAEEAAREAEFLAEDRLRGSIRPAVSEALANLSAGGCRVVIVTASLRFLAAPVAGAVAAHGLLASVPEESGGVLTGRLVGPRPWGREKSTLVQAMCDREGVSPGDCVAMGDSWPDRHMMLRCGRAIAVHPSPGLRRLATRMGWQVLEGRHTRWA
jgi:HAD superfamily phosphoserine phosphatase-like hydrolase